MAVPVTQAKEAEFRASGRPAGARLEGGLWRRDPEGGEVPDGTLPPLTDGEAVLRESKVEAKHTVRRRATMKVLLSTPCKTPGISSRTRQCANGCSPDTADE